MSPRGFGSVFTRARSLRRSRTGNSFRRRTSASRRIQLAAEPLESRCMLSTTATLFNDTSMFDRISVTHPLRPANVPTSFVGQFFWNGFNSFCVEIGQSISPGLHTFPTRAPLASSGLANAGLVADFWRSYGPKTTGFTSVTDAAAFQLGIWELISDGPSRNLKSGSFQVGASASPAVARAESWLNGTGTPAPSAGGPAVSLYVLQHPTRQDQVVWEPRGVDLDVDSNNDGRVAEDDDPIEEKTDLPGVIVPVGGDRAKMVVDVPKGITATLAFDAAAAAKVKVFAASGAVVLEQGRLSTSIASGSAQTFWIEAFAPSATMADIAFTLTAKGGSPASSDTIRATAVAVDLDVDTNNDGTIDPDNGPAGKDDRIEEDSTRGLVVPVYAGDSDRDGHDDARDFNGISARRFSPVKVSLSRGAAEAWRKPLRLAGAPSEDLPGLMFTFTFPDAGFRPAPEGAFRLWKKDAPSVRTDTDLIRSGVPIPAAEFFAGQPFTNWNEYLSNYGTTTLYLEAVAPTEGYEPIVVSIGGTGAWAKSTTTDTVHVRPLETTFDLGVDSNNNEGFGVPQRSPAAEQQWEEKLEDHTYALGKLVMQSSSSQIGDTIAEDRLAASFTPVIVELPKNLPVDATTIGVKFAMDAIGASFSGEIRLWNRNKGAGLLSQDAAGEPPHPMFPLGRFGHRVHFGKPYTLSQINYDPATGQAVLYMDGHVATGNVTLNAAEQRVWPHRGILEATLTFDAPDLRIPLAEDSVQYMVVRTDFFYRDLQFGSVGLGSTGSQVRSALASRGVYSYADLPSFALKRLTTQQGQNGPPGELQEILELAPDSDAVALLYNDADKPGNPTAYPGFKAVLYQDYAAVADNTFVLAFGGTDDSLGEILTLNPPDWVENIGQGLGWRIAQYRWAMDVAREVEFATRGVSGGATLTTTGHSLGGGLASAASVVTGATGVTFNAAGLHEKSLRMYFENDPAELVKSLARYHNPNGLVTAYTVDWDFLSNFQDRLSPDVNTALGDREKLDGPYDLAANTLILIDSAVNVAGASPIGVLVKLGINVATKAGLGYLMVRAHSMDVVLYGMLVEERTNRDLLGYPRSRFL